MTDQSDWIQEAERRRDAGLTAATAHAEDELEGWNADAYRALLEYVFMLRGLTFMAEDFVAWASSRISAPPDPRAWGGPITRAARRGLIVRTGYAPANSSNLSPKCVWREA